MQSLPKGLAKRGHRVMTVVPRYKEYEEAIDTGVRTRLKVLGQDVEVGFFHHYRDGVDIVFVDHNSYHYVRDSIYSGDRSAQTFRNSLLCQAALELPYCIAPGDVPYGDENLIFVANDWHTALLPVYLQGYFRDYGKYEFARSCFIVHNMAHQGRGPLDEFDQLGLDSGKYKEQFYLDDPYGGECMNIMQAGLRLATKVIAVSEGYAWEISTDMGGRGLAPCVREFGEGKLSGIVNGIDYDEWSPDADEHLMSDGYTTYSPDASGLDGGKKQCKRALQRELGLPEDENALLIGFIGRLDDQKGVDLITDSEWWFRDNHVQLVMLGSGRDDLENALRGMEERNKDKIRGWVGFSVKMSHRITAACDCLLMPSRFEPCGLNQLYAMRYGTVPIVHAVGGLRDTVQPYDPYNKTGTGWCFDCAESHLLRETMGYALGTYRDHRESFCREFRNQTTDEQTSLRPGPARMPAPGYVLSPGILKEAERSQRRARKSRAHPEEAAYVVPQHHRHRLVREEVAEQERGEDVQEHPLEGAAPLAIPALTPPAQRAPVGGVRERKDRRDHGELRGQPDGVPPLRRAADLGVAPVLLRDRPQQLLHEQPQHRHRLGAAEAVEERFRRDGLRGAVGAVRRGSDSGAAASADSTAVRARRATLSWDGGF